MSTSEDGSRKKIGTEQLILFLEITNIPILLEDPTFENYGNNRWENKGIFTDLTFDGQSKTIDIAINTYEIEEKVEELDFFEIRIFNITRAAYLYNKSYDLYLNASGNPLLNLFRYTAM